MTTYGYARVSTDGQTLDAQLHQLRVAGAEKVFSEAVSPPVFGRDGGSKVAWLDISLIKAGIVGRSTLLVRAEEHHVFRTAGTRKDL
jgi:hypothetical protein